MEFTKGQKVYVSSSDSRVKGFNAVVTSIGSKYITVTTDYEEKYKRTLEKARKELQACGSLDCDAARQIFRFFPELAESEDEKIKKLLIEAVIQVLQDQYCSNRGISKEKVVAWLEKQGEQKPDDNRLIPQKGEYYVCIKNYYSADGKTTNTKGKIYKSPCDGYINDDRGFGLSWINSCTENYFRLIKEEDWIVCEQYNVIGKPLQYKEFMNNKLTQKNIKSLEDKGIVPNFRLWTIADAKDGDVLTCYSDIKGQPIEQTGIIKQYVGRHGGCSNSFKAHFGVDWDNNVVIEGYMGSSNIYPATKEQRDTLIQAMFNAGYTFDFEKKELKKIEQKPAWSEKEKNEMFSDIITAIRAYYKCEREDLIEYFKNTHLCPKQEWSEEDEKMRAAVLQLITDSEKENCWNCVYCNDKEIYFSDIISWLKSLRPQKQWKPSEEQMDALNDVISSRDIKYDVLSELWKDLKQL